MHAKHIDHVALVQALHYNPKTGIFTWRETWSSRAVKGTQAGTLSKQTGYRIIRLGGLNYHAHRFAWVYCYGYIQDSEEVDHYNMQRDDNRLGNLRKGDGSSNKENQREAHANNLTTGLLGVFYSKRWRVYRSKITVRGEVYRLGQFQSAEAAQQAYIQAKRKLHLFGTL